MARAILNISSSARSADASVAVRASALVGHRRDADIAGELAAVGEGPVKHFRAPAPRRSSCRCRVCVGEPRSSGSSHRRQSRPAPQRARLPPRGSVPKPARVGAAGGRVRPAARTAVRGRRRCAARRGRAPTSAATASSRCPCEQQRLYPILDTQPLLDKVFAFTVRTFGILLFRRRHTHHAANLSISGQPGGEHAKHALGIEPVGLGPAGAALHQDAGRLEHVGSDAVHRQRSVQPEPVPARLEATDHLRRLAQLGQSAPA
jgi:hypothetical protein